MARHGASMVLVLGLLLMPGTGFSGNVVGVSPGAADRLTTVEARCPTFSWSGEPGASEYEIVVYRIVDERIRSNPGALNLEACEEVLYTVVPGGAAAWQPDLPQGLQRGADYVWFVRARFDDDGREEREAGPWSEGRFFSIADSVTEGELEQALSVVRQFLEQHPEGGAEPVRNEAFLEKGQSPRGPTLEDRSSDGAAKSVPTAVAAIRGSIPDSGGETYGVVGLSASTDGAGVAAANTGGGPDLVLDGSADGLSDALISESGIDRPSAVPQTFSIGNSAGGGMALQVDGAAVLTTASTIDADTLDGIDGVDYSTDAETAGLVAAHAASADHDGRYYTETELGMSGSAAVHWDNVTNMPPGFADGVDNDTIFTIGPGLILDGGTIRVDPGFSPPQTAAVDTSSLSIGDPAMVFGDSNLELMAYSFDNHQLRISGCLNSLCTDAATTIVEDDDTGTTQFSAPSAVIGQDGRMLVAYTAVSGTGSSLKAAHCDDDRCSSATTSVLESGAGFVGYFTSIAVDPEGYGLISYFADETLKVARCDNTQCTTATSTVLDDSGSSGWYTSITVGNDGRGLITYLDGTDLSLKVAHCDNAECSSGTISTVEMVGRELSPSIAVGGDGFGLVTYCGNNGLTVAHCNDIACTTSAKTVVDAMCMPGWETDVRIAGDGFGVIGYVDTDRDLKLVHCADSTCSTASSAEVASNRGIGGLSCAIDGHGRTSISFTSYQHELMVTHLGIGVP